MPLCRSLLDSRRGPSLKDDASCAASLGLRVMPLSKEGIAPNSSKSTVQNVQTFKTDSAVVEERKIRYDAMAK